MDIWTKKKRSEVMSNIRSKNTKPEIKLRKALFAEGYRYLLHDKKLPGKPDIVLTKYKTAIFVHGCFWHYHKNCPEGRIPKSNIVFWKNKLLNNVKRDLKHQRELKRSGWNVIVIWECELEDKKTIKNKVLQLKSILKSK